MASDVKEVRVGCLPTFSEIVKRRLAPQVQDLLKRMRARDSSNAPEELKFMFIHRVEFLLVTPSTVEWDCDRGWKEELLGLFREKPAAILVFDFLSRDHIHRFMRMEDARAPLVFPDGHDATQGMAERKGQLDKLLVKPEDMFLVPLTWRLGGEVACIKHTFLSRNPEGQIVKKEIHVSLPKDDPRCRTRLVVQAMLLAFCMGTHSRLGADSPVLQLDANAMQMVFEFFVSEMGRLHRCITAVDVRECLAELGEIDLSEGY